MNWTQTLEPNKKVQQITEAQQRDPPGKKKTQKKSEKGN